MSALRRALRRYRKSGDGLALVAGLALPLAFAPCALGPVAPLAAAALFLSWLDASPRRALWRGWLFGAGAFGVGVSWIVHSFLVVQVALPVALFLTTGLVALLAFYPALTGYLVRRFVSGPPAMVLLAAIPAAWVLMEWTRGWLLTGFPWLELGYSQIDWPLAGWFPVLGVHGVSFMTALSAGALAFVAASASRRRCRNIQKSMLGARLCIRARHARTPFRHSRESGNPFRSTSPETRVSKSLGRRWLALALPVVLWVAGGGFGLVDWTQPAGAPLRVALVQGNIAQEHKWLPEMREPTLDRYLGLSRRHLEARLIVWPETALPAVYQSVEALARALDREFATMGKALLFGVPWRDRARGLHHNSLVLLGAERGLYHKRHLVPFGEYLPLRPFLLPLTRFLGVPSPDFSPGPATPPLSVAGHLIAPTICYEIAFAAEVAASLPEAQLLVTVSNDAWFGASVGPHQHLEIARARAKETGRYLARATNTGISALVSPGGEVLARSPQFEVDVIEVEMVPMSGATPYVRAGNAPTLAAAFALLITTIVVPKRRGRSGSRESAPWKSSPHLSSTSD